MGFFDSIGNFFKKAAGGVSNFFTKTVPQGATGIFNKVGGGIQSAYNAARPILDMAGKVINNPIVGMAASALAPELTPLIAGAKGGLALATGQNPLEALKSAVIPQIVSRFV